MPPAVDEDVDQHVPSPPAFVPCVEDAAYTRQIGRHPAAFQRTLDAVSYEYLVATSRRARQQPSAHAAYAQTLSTNYTRLWAQRSLVPKTARREWFETVMVHLHALNRLEASVLWLMDDLNEEKIEGANQAASTNEVPPPSAPSFVPDATDTHTPAQARKQPKGKKLAQDTLPLWHLWQDTQRHLHHLTLRLRAWTPARGGAYAAREALRPVDLVRMDSAAFTWRVRQWTQVSSVVLADAAATLRVTHPSVNAAPAQASPCQVENCDVLPSSASPFTEEEPELYGLLSALTSSNMSDGVAVRQQVAGALLYRMLLEVMLIRLRALPRCLFTWRLLRDVLRRCTACINLVIPTAEQTRDEKDRVSTALLSIGTYIEAVILPYLEQRDCHLGNLNHTATDIQAHFTQLSESYIRTLRTVATSHQAGSPDHNVQETSSKEASKFNRDGRLAEEQRRSLSAALSNAIRDVCGYSEETPTLSAAAADILANDKKDDNGNNNSVDVANHEHGGALMTSTEVTIVALRKELVSKQVNDRLFCSASCRTCQLDVFFYHYFTQSPTAAFDRLHRGIATEAPSAIEEGG